jgi:hypothetical protein
MDVLTITVLALIGLMIFQTVAYTRAMDNSTKALNALRDTIMFNYKQSGLHEELLKGIIEKLDSMNKRDR